MTTQEQLLGEYAAREALYELELRQDNITLESLTKEAVESFEPYIYEYNLKE